MEGKAESKSHIGATIKRFQLRHKMSLRKLASKVGLSAGFISRIEKGDANPSLETFEKLARFFGCRVGFLLAEKEDGKGYRVTRDRIYRMARSSDRNVMVEFLTDSFDGNPRMEVGILTIKPGTTFSNLYLHLGEELYHIIEGHVRAKIGEREIELEAGQTLNFDPRLEHGVTNIGPGEAKVLYALAPPKAPVP